jgi:hypothetical protein
MDAFVKGTMVTYLRVASDNLTHAVGTFPGEMPREAADLVHEASQLLEKASFIVRRTEVKK